MVVELIVAIAAIGNWDLWCQTPAHNLAVMEQDKYTPMPGDQVASSARSSLAEEGSRGVGYSRPAILLHWAIAVLVLSTIPIGLYGASDKNDAAQAATNLHKSIGIVILALTVIRVAWRLGHTPPPLPDSMNPALRRIARLTQGLFYFLLLVLPFSGWWMSSAVPQRHPFGFGLFDVPFLPVPRGWASAGPAHFVHVNLAWVMVGLAALHIAAALKHHFVDRDAILAGMLPRRA